MRQLVCLFATTLLLLGGLAAPSHAQGLAIAVDEVVSPGEDVEVRIRLPGGGDVRPLAWRVGNPGALLDAGLDLGRGERFGWLMTDAAARRVREAASLQPVPQQGVVRVPKAGDATARIRLAAPGLYVIGAQLGHGTAYATALATDLGLVTKRSKASLLVWAVHRKTGKPWPGVRIDVAGEKGGGVTDETGAYRLDAPLRTTARVRAHAKQHVAFSDAAWHPSTSSDRRVYVFTHQPAYRPGETVEVKGIVRAVVAGAARLDAHVRTVKVELVLGGERVLAAAEVPISSDMGTFAASLALPKDAPTGQGAVRATIGARRYEGALLVDAYRKPRFEVRVKAMKPRVFAGDLGLFRIEASTYDGLPLAGAKVQWSLFWQRMDRELFDEDDLTRLFFGAEREAYRPVELKQGEGRLDDRGRLPVALDAPKDRLDGRLVLRAVVAGPDGVSVAGSGRMGLANAPLYVALTTDRHVYGPEDVVRVVIRAERADGEKAADRDGVLTVGRAADGEQEESWLHTLPFQTNALGEASVDAPLAGAGRYVLAVAMGRLASEPAGPPVNARHLVLASGERTTPSDRLEVTADKDTYQVGDVARLLVTTPALDTPVLFTAEGAALGRATVLSVQGGSHLVELPVREEDAPTLHVGFQAVQDGRLLAVRRVLRIPPVSKRLLPQIRPDRERVEPGETVGVTIAVRDAEAKPAANAEVALAVVDASLFALHRDPSAPIEAFFHPPRRNDVTTGEALSWSSVGWLPAPPRRKALRDTGAMPAPGSAMPEAEAPGAIEEMDEESGEETLNDDEPASSDAGAPAESPAPVMALEKKEGKSEPPAAETREDFRTAVWWSPTLRTNADGVVRLEKVKLGDTLTRWRMTATTVDADTRVGRAEAHVTTSRAVTAEIVAPRFLLAGDRVELPLLLRNLTTETLEGEWRLGLEVKQGFGEGEFQFKGPITLAPRSTRVVRHPAGTPEPGPLIIEAAVSTPRGSDAERRRVAVLPRGIPKVDAHRVRANQGEGRLTLRLPEKADPGSIEVSISIEPAYAQAMIAALPYLADYPYGCTEQTMSRFVPLLAAGEALLHLGKKPDHALAELPKMIAAGLDRLDALRHDDGGFGWWRSDVTDPGMTALVARGLTRLIKVDPDNARAKRLRDGAVNALAALVAKRGQQGDHATQAGVFLALAGAGRLKPEALPSANDATWRMAPPIARAFLLRAAVAVGRADLIVAFRGLLDDEARREGEYVWWSPVAIGDAAPQRWQDDAIETTAAVLYALLEAGADARLMDPGFAWLVDARKGGTIWRSTRDTAAAVEALAAYVGKTGDLGAGRVVSLGFEHAQALGGRAAGERTLLFKGALDLDKTLAGQATVALPPELCTPGHEVDLVLHSAEGRAMAAVRVRYRESGAAIRASDAGFKVTRRLFRLEPRSPQDGKVVWERVPVTETLPSGTLVECEIEVTSPEPREFVMVTSPHAAGFEPAADLPIEVAGRDATTPAEVERYDDRTQFFPRRLEAGRSLFRHRLRATHVGTFTALPAQAELMYFPDTRGSSDGEPWEITEKGAAGQPASGKGGR